MQHNTITQWQNDINNNYLSALSTLLYSTLCAVAVSPIFSRPVSRLRSVAVPYPYPAFFSLYLISRRPFQIAASRFKLPFFLLLVAFFCAKSWWSHSISYMHCVADVLGFLFITKSCKDRFSFVLKPDRMVHQWDSAIVKTSFFWWRSPHTHVFLCTRIPLGAPRYRLSSGIYIGHVSSTDLRTSGLAIFAQVAHTHTHTHRNGEEADTDRAKTQVAPTWNVVAGATLS